MPLGRPLYSLCEDIALSHPSECVLKLIVFRLFLLVLAIITSDLDQSRNLLTDLISTVLL